MAEIILTLTALGLVAFVFYHIQRVVFKYAVRTVSKIMPILILTALLAAGYIVQTVGTAKTRSKELFTSADMMGIDIMEALFVCFAVLIFTAIAGCVIAVAAAKIKHRIEQRITAAKE
jgi:hypothetical protein